MAAGASGVGHGGGRRDGLSAAGVMMIRCRVVRAESVLWWRIPISMNGKKRCALTGWHALTRPLWMEDFSSGLRHELLMPDAFAAAADVAAASRHQQQQQQPYGVAAVSACMQRLDCIIHVREAHQQS